MNRIKKLLLIDDDLIVNIIHEDTIKSADFADAIEARTSVNEALNYLKNLDLDEVPELIFLDINMPQRNGWDFIEDFKKMKFGIYKPKIIMVTSSINPEDKNRAHDGGVVEDFVSKPLDAEVLGRIRKNFFIKSNTED